MIAWFSKVAVAAAAERALASMARANRFALVGGLALCAASAHASTLTNALTYNALTYNSLSQNALTYNALDPNGPSRNAGAAEVMFFSGARILDVQLPGVGE